MLQCLLNTDLLCTHTRLTAVSVVGLSVDWSLTYRHMFCSTLPPVGGSRRQEDRPCPGTAPCPPGTHTSHSGLCSRFEWSLTYRHMFCSTLPPVGENRRLEDRPCPGTAPCPPGIHMSHSGLCSRFECRLKSDLPSHVLQHSTSRGWEQETGGQTLPWHCTLPSRHTHVSQRSL